MKNYNLTLVANNEVINLVVENKPKVGDEFIHNGLVYCVRKVVLINSIADTFCEKEYYTCVCDVNIERIGVIQVKIFYDVNFEYLNEIVNEYLYENRHKLEILSIDYNNCTCMIKYRQRNSTQIENSIYKEKQMLIGELKLVNW